jgi:hypothetical protein
MLLPGTYTRNQPFTLPLNQGRAAAVAFTTHTLQGSTIRGWIKAKSNPILSNGVDPVCCLPQSMIDALYTIEAIPVITTAKQQNLLPLLVGLLVQPKRNHASYSCGQLEQREIKTHAQPRLRRTQVATLCGTLAKAGHHKNPLRLRHLARDTFVVDCSAWLDSKLLSMRTSSHSQRTKSDTIKAEIKAAADVTIPN